MTADIESLVLEQLRAIRADIAELKHEAASTNIQLSAMGQQLGALTTAASRKSTNSRGVSNEWNGDWS